MASVSSTPCHGRMLWYSISPHLSEGHCASFCLPKISCTIAEWSSVVTWGFGREGFSSHFVYGSACSYRVHWGQSPYIGVHYHVRWHGRDVLLVLMLLISFVVYPRHPLHSSQLRWYIIWSCVEPYSIEQWQRRSLLCYIRPGISEHSCFIWYWTEISHHCWIISVLKAGIALDFTLDFFNNFFQQLVIMISLMALGTRVRSVLPVLDE